MQFPWQLTLRAAMYLNSCLQTKCEQTSEMELFGTVRAKSFDNLCQPKWVSRQSATTVILGRPFDCALRPSGRRFVSRRRSRAYHDDSWPNCLMAASCVGPTHRGGLFCHLLDRSSIAKCRPGRCQNRNSRPAALAPDEPHCYSHAVNFDRPRLAFVIPIDGLASRIGDRRTISGHWISWHWIIAASGL